MNIPFLSFEVFVRMLNIRVKLLIFCALISGGFSNSLDCNNGMKYFIEDRKTIDLSAYRGCDFIIETSTDRILAFQPLNDFSLTDILNFLKIKDGLTKEFKYLTIDDQQLNPGIRQSALAMKTLYTKKNIAMIGISDEVPEGFSIRISKAVECPFNLGAESQCGRVVDPESCYCATFTKRTWQDQNDFCLSKGFRFLALETVEEETGIRLAWGVDTDFWMSLNDRVSEGVWVWDSLGSRLYPGYANWNDGEPNDGIQNANEDCGELTSYDRHGWNDKDCATLKDGLCEKHP